LRTWRIPGGAWAAAQELPPLLQALDPDWLALIPQPPITSNPRHSAKIFARRNSEPTRMSSVKEEISQMNTFPDIFVLDSTLVESPSVEGGYCFSVSRRRDDFCITGLHLF
jgi:hypothetical protein